MGRITLRTQDETGSWCEVPVKRFSFSGGELQVRIEGLIAEIVAIVAHLHSSDDLVSLPTIRACLLGGPDAQ